ncbi:MAG TPA: hypothetical protein DCG54_01700 [Anaerolineae bacterium]|jgi:hypothetical protein|nr:hypothetical protein [Anaerolineae bacterium]
MLRQLSTQVSNLLSAVFFKPDEEKWQPLQFIWLVSLYLLGIFIWGKFLSWNTAPLDYHDWVGITLPRLAILQNAFRAGVFPFHVQDTAALHEISDRYLVLPDVITTPQTLLLLFVNLNTFVLIDILFHYTLGMLGLLWLRTQKNLSLISFTILFFLFNFNGYILAHYSVGHFTWGGYFLFPVIFGLLFEFTAGKVGWRWTGLFCLTLFYMILAGGQHHFVWILLFISPLLLTSGKNAKWILAVIILAGLLSAVRLLPPALALSLYEKKQNFNFVLGYPSVQHLFQAMVLPDVPVETLLASFGLNSFEENIWEFNFYVGILGTVFILYFGLWHWFKKYYQEYKQFILPVFFVFFLSIGSNYWLIRNSEFPLFGSERVTSRMVAVPLTFLIVFSVIFFQKWLATHRQAPILTASGLFLAFLTSDLWNNLKLWRLSDRANYFQPLQMDLSTNIVANHADPLYFSVISIGFGITIFVAAFLLVMSWREKKP